MLRGDTENRPYFRQALGHISLRWPAEHDPSFRAAQVGAVLGLASHFATATTPAQAVLPTGVGKSAVIVALPFLVPTERALVVVPTRLLRDQVAEEFSSLATLKRIGAFPADFVPPRVTRVEHRVADAADWESLRGFDVVVATPAVISSTYEGVASPPFELFDLLIFDEAHHLPATTWIGILNEHQARAALLTATPFRRDRKRLPGRLAYHYSLRQAIDDGVYAPVSFVPADVTGTTPDRAIARRAIARQASSPHLDEGSLLMIRTDRVAHARDLVSLYRELGAEVGLITGEHGTRHVRGVLKKLASGELKGVVSVGALVEGFDLPALKIAAYHRPHRSLPPTLQFVGRIARVTGGAAPAELVAVPSEIAGETSELYAEDVAWSALLPRLVDATVERERVTRDYVANLDSDGPEEVSPSALVPRRIVQVFRTSGQDVDLTTQVVRLARLPVVFHAIDDDRRLMAAIVEQRISPEWLASDALDSLQYHLFLAVHDPDRGLLFISAPSDTSARELRDTVGAREAPLVSPQLINRWLWSQDPVAYSSVGMRSARAVGARQASYRMLAGSAVEGALLPSESRAYAAGHLIGRRRNGLTTSGIGVSMRRSKIWETEPSDSLLSFREWCDGLAAALTLEPGDGHATAPRLSLALPAQLELFPEHPLTIVLDHSLTHGDTNVRLPDGAEIDIVLFETPVERMSDERLLVRWAFEDDEIAVIELQLDGTAQARGSELTVQTSAGPMSLSDLLSEYPPAVYYADGSSSQGATKFVPPSDLPVLPADLFVDWDWSDTDIRKESRQPEKAGKTENVQATAVRHLRSALSDPVIIMDDAAYEIADVVAIERLAGSFRVHFVHCKYSSGDNPGARLGDLYEVAGQAVRSCRWTDTGACWEELARRIADRNATSVEGLTRQEARELLDGWVDETPAIEPHVWAVQPGLSRQRVANWQEGQTLLLSAMEWCVTQGASFRVACSA